MRLQVQLADVYRELSRVSDAERIQSELRKELQFADSDHPILLACSQVTSGLRRALPVRGLPAAWSNARAEVHPHGHMIDSAAFGSAHGRVVAIAEVCSGDIAPG
jgi:hypothetical protein